VNIATRRALSLAPLSCRIGSPIGNMCAGDCSLTDWNQAAFREHYLIRETSRFR